MTDMIDYGCKGLLKVLLKKWYVIMGIALMMGGVAIPISNLSYKNALDNYISTQDMASGRVKEFYNETAYYKIKDDENAQLYFAFINDINFMDYMCSLYSVNLEWKNASSMISCLLLGENVFKLCIHSDTQEEIQILTDVIIDIVPLYMKENGIGSVQFEELVSWNETSQKEVSVLRQPVKSDNLIKIVGFAFLLGIAVGCFVVLLRDYLQRCKEVEKVV